MRKAKQLKLDLPARKGKNLYLTGFFTLSSMIIALVVLLSMAACTTQPISLTTGQPMDIRPPAQANNQGS